MGIGGLSIRSASEADSAALAALFTAIGFPVAAEEMPARLARTKAASEHVYVAEAESKVIGCIATSAMMPPHRAAPVGRISVLVVAEESRGLGVGRALVGEALDRLSREGCTLAEVTSRFELEAAHRFYESMGFENTSFRLARPT